MSQNKIQLEDTPYPGSHKLRLKYQQAKSWEFWMLCMSDNHHDGMAADHRLEKKHLDMAKERNAKIIMVGDVFDVMQGKWDKRSDANHLRPELHGNNYLDLVTAYNADFYRPYAENILLISMGNHETAMLKAHHTNLTERLVERINTHAHTNIKAGEYEGLIKILCECTSGGHRKGIKLFYHHGSGGSSPVTGGTAKATKRQATVRADIVITGHTADEYYFPKTYKDWTDSGKPFKADCMHLQCPGYGFGDNDSHVIRGWAAEREFPPKTNGAWWLRFYYDTYDKQVRYEPTPAK